ncbi:MAG: malto-oligosyltrehalose synthase [Gammaproteobacteria bacterium]
MLKPDLTVPGAEADVGSEPAADVSPSPALLPQERSEPRPWIPRATYRIQLNAGFTFRQATELIPYLDRLGISHVYCSPYFRARAGSVHGYDVVDHNSLNQEIGTREDFEAFVAALRAHGMGHILDFVPNHVGIMGADNAWWMDVLENGKASRYAEFFDIDWSPPNPALAGQLLVPALGTPYGTTLESGELQLRYEPENGSLAVFYHDHRFPVDPQSYPIVLERALKQAVAGEAQAEHRLELESLVSAFRKLPNRESTEPAQVTERDRDKELHKRRLTGLLGNSPELTSAVQAAVAEICGNPSDPASFDGLHELLELQCYRLAYWRVAADDINYRRFFDVNDLAALRMENPQVFAATHRLLLELIRENKLDGLRIDHPDGLYDPAGYFEKLQREAAQARSGAASAGPDVANVPTSNAGASTSNVFDPDTRPTASTSHPTALPIYLLVEKITASFERLPQTWQVHGTTGYNFTNVINGLLVDSRAKSRLDRIYQSFIIDYVEWADVAYDSKVLVLRTSLASELNVLANQLARIAQADRHTRDFTMSNLRHALTEVIACFPVYRTYVTDTASDDDKRYIDWAIARARRRSSSTDVPLLNFVRSMLLADTSAIAAPMHAQVRAFAGKFQQVTAPVTAKGVEDTALYRFTRLASLNEVGGEPGSFGFSVRQFHADAQHRAKNWPHEMLATSTHDTKRAEDARARMSVLSEIPSLWRQAIQRWSRMNRARRREVDDLPAPGAHAEYLLYQTLLGTWPMHTLGDDAFAVYRERIEEYMVKASREGKRRTSWANVNAEYEEALRQFIRAALDRREGNPFPTEIADFARRMSRFGYLNSLSQTLCKLTAPGVPDIYQGNEIWDDSLVDPDNRRPVDYLLRQRLLDEVLSWSSGAPDALTEHLSQALSTLDDGRSKLYLTATVLAFRRTHEALFRDGEYFPVRVTGKYATHVLAYARRLGDEFAIAVVPRLTARLAAGGDEMPLGAARWADTQIELPRQLRVNSLSNTLDGTIVEVSEDDGSRTLLLAAVLAHFPVALLASRSPQSPGG